MKILQKCQHLGANFHPHETDVELYEEVEVNCYDGQTTVKDFREGEQAGHRNCEEELEELPDIDRIRRATNTARDSFERSNFSNISEQFRVGVVPKGRPQKIRGGPRTFKSTKPSRSDTVKDNSKEGSISSKRKINDVNDTEKPPPKKRGRPNGSKNKSKADNANTSLLI